ncbi:MAG: tetratricopeptide repeat protein, partial [Planctomycetota bacterium]
VPPTDDEELARGWLVDKSPESSGKLKTERGRLVLTGEEGRYHHIERPLGLDGTDEAPLVVDCQISAGGREALRVLPTFVALYWGADQIVAVGPRDADHRQQGAQALWVAGDRREVTQNHTGLGEHGTALHFRIVVASRDVTAFASGDGVRYRPVVSLERLPGRFSGAPELLILGRGGNGEGSERQPDLDNDHRHRKRRDLYTYTFSGLRVSNDRPRPPTSPPPGYEKHDTWEQTLEAFEGTRVPLRWWLLGPLGEPKRHRPDRGMEIGDRKGPHDGRGDAWVSHTLEEEEIGRPIDLNSALVKVRKNSLGLAYTEILAPAPRTERIYFDGRDRVDLFVNGWWAGGGEGQRDSPLVPDRRVVTVALSKGRNDIVIKVVRRSRDWRFVLRHEGAEPPPNSRNRIALLRALIADFGTDGPATDPADSHIGGGGRFARAIRRGSARFEIARTWAAMGYARRAIEVLGEVARDESVTSEEYGRAYLERVRLFRRLRDAKSAAADLRAFAERLPERSTERFEATLNYLAAELDAGGSFSVDEAIRLYAGSKEGRPKGPGDSESPVDAQRLRRVHAFLAGAYEKRKEEGPRLDHMRRLVFTRGARDPREDALHVEYAEALLAPVREALRHAGTPDGIKKAWPGILERWQFRIGEALDHYRRAGRIALDGPRSGAGRPGAPAAVVASMNEASRAFFDGDYAAALRLLPAAYVRARLWRESEGQPDPWVLDGPRRPVPAGRNWREVDGQLKSRVVRHGPVTGWHVVGPFDNTDWKAYAEDIVPPPPPGSRIDTRRKVRGTQWRIPDRKYYNGHTINLMQLYNKNNVVVYLYKEVKSDREASAVLRMGADDGLTFWFNGKKLHEDRTQRGINPDEISLPVRFRKGTNTLLARVQQGSGDWAFALRIDWRTTAPSDIARLVLLLEHFPGAHRELASVFFEHANNLVGKGHYDKGAALARVVIAAFPDDPERQIQTAMTFMDHGVRDGRDLASAAELGAWALGYIERRALSNKSGYLYEIRRRYWQTLRALGDLKGAVHQLSQIVRSDPGADRVAEASRALAELHRAAGYPEAAARYYRRILDYPGMNDHLLAEARARLSEVRHPRTESAFFDVSFNAATLVRTADRAAARKDIGWAPEYYQRAIDLHSGRLLRSGNDRYVGVVDYCAARIRSLGTEGIAAYRKMVDRRARAMYERALLDRDVVLLQRVASVYPASSVADDALNRAGNLRLEQGRPARAAHIFGRILEEHPDTNIDRAMLLAKYAFASELALDRAGARRAFDLLTRHFG